MPTRPPLLAYGLGFAGLIPFLVCSLASIAGNGPADTARYLTALIGYAAVILAFLGGVHWGFVLSPMPGDPDVAAGRTRARLVLGVAPSLVGWLALLLLLLNLADVSLAVLLAGFVAVTASEARLNRLGRLPPGYMPLRWILSIVVILLLSTTLVVRLVGGHIMF
jgi:hypothetical protein